MHRSPGPGRPLWPSPPGGAGPGARGGAACRAGAGRRPGSGAPPRGGAGWEGLCSSPRPPALPCREPSPPPHAAEPTSGRWVQRRAEGSSTANSGRRFLGGAAPPLPAAQGVPPCAGCGDRQGSSAREHVDAAPRTALGRTGTPGRGTWPHSARVHTRAGTHPRGVNTHTHSLLWSHHSNTHTVHTSVHTFPTDMVISEPNIPPLMCGDICTIKYRCRAHTRSYWLPYRNTHLLAGASPASHSLHVHSRVASNLSPTTSFLLAVDGLRHSGEDRG